MTTKSTISRTTAFYPAGPGKFHAAKAVSGTAACGAALVIETGASPIVGRPGQEISTLHPIVCRRCARAS